MAYMRVAWYIGLCDIDVAAVIIIIIFLPTIIIIYLFIYLFGPRAQSLGQ